MKRKSIHSLALFGTLYVGMHTILFCASSGRVQRAWGVPNTFLYVPAHPDWVVANTVPLYVHFGLRYAFYPLWKVQELLLGGPCPMQYPPMLGIGGATSRSFEHP